jgi:hypothetical protein
VRNGTHTSHSCVCLSSATLSNQSHVVSFSRDTPKPTRDVDSMKPCRSLFPKRRPVQGAARSEISIAVTRHPNKQTYHSTNMGFLDQPCCSVHLYHSKTHTFVSPGIAWTQDCTFHADDCMNRCTGAYIGHSAFLLFILWK